MRFSKSFLVALVALTVVCGVSVHADEPVWVMRPVEKLARGIANAAFCPLELPMQWIKVKNEQGGIAGIEEINNAKAAKLYSFIDESTFFSCPAAKADRSRMNVVFRTPSDELDAKFVADAKAAGLTELKGHRLVGGCRASIYNAMPMEGIDALIDFMKKFEVANR